MLIKHELLKSALGIDLDFHIDPKKKRELDGQYVLPQLTTKKTRDSFLIGAFCT